MGHLVLIIYTVSENIYIIVKQDFNFAVINILYVRCILYTDNVFSG